MSRKPVQDDLDLGQMAEAELERLQRQYRIMEGDRNAFCEDFQQSLRKQSNVIAHLSKEKSNLKLKLSVIKNPLNDLKDNKTALELSKLLRKSNKYENDTKVRNAQLKDLKLHIRKMEKELVTLRRKDVTDSQSLSQAVEYKQTIDTLENRLNVVSVKYNKILSINTSLREELDHLLKERKNFNNLYQQLVSRLEVGKKSMIDLIEQATIAYDQREEAQGKLQTLKERCKQDLLIHGQEVRELMRKLDHDAKLQDFLGVKGQKRTMADLEAKEAAKKLAQREATEALIEEYQSILAKITEFSGEEQVDKLAAQFVKEEEENFALFNYVNELNNELEVMQDQVEDLQVAIDKQRLVNKERAQQQHDTLNQLQESLETLITEAKTEQDKLDIIQAVYNKLLAGVEELFQLIRCTNAPILDLLGCDVHVTSYNVLLYLGIIERRVADMTGALSQIETGPTSELPDLISKLKLTS